MKTKPRKEVEYCDDCGEPLKGEKFVVFSELPFSVASANEGESAIVCPKCLKKHGWVCPSK